MRSLLNAAMIGLMISSTPAQALDCVVWFQQPWLDRSIDRTSFIFRGVMLKTLAERVFTKGGFKAAVFEVRVDEIYKGDGTVMEGDTIKVVKDSWCDDCKQPSKEDLKSGERAGPAFPHPSLYFVHEVSKPADGRVGDWTSVTKEKPMAGVRWRPAVGVKWGMGICDFPSPLREWEVNHIKQRLASTVGQLE